METSFQSRSTHFYLVVLIYHQGKASSSQRQLLMAAASPKLYVESRKKYWSERQSLVEIFDPFLPNCLDKAYEITDKLNHAKALLSNDLLGLNNYLTSSTIRHKIRHPFFLLGRFSQGVKLYYNTELISPDESYENKLILIQKLIYQDLNKKTEYQI